MSSSSSTMNSATSSILSQSNNLPNITNFMSVKLDETNYLNWRHLLLLSIKSMGLLSHLSKEHAPPAVNTPERAEWDKTDGYTQALIAASLSPALLHLARNASTAADLWKSIADSFHQAYFARKSQLQAQFYTTKQGDKSISVFLNEIKEIFDGLNAIDENSINEDLLVMRILQSLNGEYENFVVTIESSDQRLNYNQLRAKLLTHENRMQQRLSIPSSPSMAAMVAVSGTPPHHQSDTRNSLTNSNQCQICAKIGHKASTCFFRYSEPDRSYMANRGNRRQSGTKGRGGGRGSRGRWQSPGNYGAHLAVNQPVGSSPWPNPNLGIQNIGDGLLGSGPGQIQLGPINSNGWASPHGLENQLSGLSLSHNGPGQVSGPNGVFRPPQFGHGSPQISSTIGSSFGSGTYFGTSSGQNSGFGPDHFRAWLGSSTGSYTSPGSSHYGLHADLATTCEQVESWIPDSGATAHMTSDPSIVFDSVPYTGPEHVVIGDESRWGGPPPHAC